MKLDTKKITLMSIGIALNILGGFIALSLKLPIYLDCIGTVLVGILLGPVYGLTVGILTGLVNGFFDPYAIYFAPVGGLVGLMSGFLYRRGLFEKNKTFLGVFLLTITTSLLGASIAAFVFDGITSSGSSYIVQILAKFGVSKVLSTFLTQLATDYVDRYLSVGIASLIARRI